MKKLTVLIAALSLLAGRASAQESRLTVDAIFGSDEFASDLVSVQWSQDPRHFIALESDSVGATDLYRVEARTGTRELLVGGNELVPPGQQRPVPIESYSFSADGSKLLIFTNSVQVWRDRTKGEFYVFDLRRRRLTPVSAQPGWQQFAKFSPDGRYVGFVRDHNIFVTDTRSGREKQLTTDGDENVINGTTDWVYEEELGLRDAFQFSPDGEYIAFLRLDQTAIKPFYLTDARELYPSLLPVRYPKAGEQNSEVRVGVVEISSGRTTWIDLGPERDIYVARLGFAGESDEMWVTRLNRHQNRLDLMLADVRSGESRVVMTDTDEAWVSNNAPLWIDDGRRFLFESERDGFNHVFLFERDGSLVGSVTTGDWDVLDVYGVSERERALYFSAAADGPLKRPLYRIGLDGGEVTRLSSASGSHDVEFNADLTMYVDTYSAAGVPPTQTLHSADGQQIRVLADNRALQEKVQAFNMELPEFIRVPGADGAQLNAYVIRPPDFDPGRRYPLLMYVYGGPGSQTVRDAWDGSRYLWHQLLAREGYLVASVDNRGTGARGRDFKKATYLRLGQLESADQIAAARYFGSLPFIDASRIGIWGWSYGGYMSLLSMFKGAGVFKAAISGAPVTDWRLYDTIYTERYMRTPQENEAGYDAGSPLAWSDRLQGHLLVVHGTSDDNVHFQNTVQLVDRLIQTGKQFDMRMFPGQRHGFVGRATRVNLYELLTAWLREHL